MTSIRRNLLWAAAVMVAASVWLGGPLSADTSPKVATFGSGCFWCTEADFDKVPGVLTTVSGFMGGTVENPTYDQVVRGGTGHTEVVQLTYDPTKVSYSELVDYFWRHVDMFDKQGQFCDRGHHYRPAIFTHDEEQSTIAKKSRRAIDTSGQFKQKIVVEITPASAFTAAEEYHQNYYLKNEKKRKSKFCYK